MLLSTTGESQSQLPPFKIKVEPDTESMTTAANLPEPSYLTHGSGRHRSEGESDVGMESTKGSRPAEDDGPIERRVRLRVSQDDGDVQAPQQHHVLPKPVHTVSSQSTAAEQHEPSFWKKRFLSKQGKNTRNLTIYAPSYSDPSTVRDIRSAPLNSNFFHHGPPHAPHQHHGEAPRTGLLHDGHTLAPLLSPRAPLNMSSAAAEDTSRSPRKQEFAIPPIVPSQQQQQQKQPPLSAHQLHSHPYIASPYGHPPRGYHNFSNGPTSAQPPATSTGSGNTPLPATAAAVPLPPKTPTTTSVAALQKQQFMQPFEHLFDTIETTRTLKTTLDEQIRRSATLMQTLQASSTTIEGLIRNQIKEAQKEMMAEMDTMLQALLKRVERLERQANTSDTVDEPTQTEMATTSNGDAHSSPQTTPSSTDQAPLAQHLQSPPTIVRSQHEIGPREYHGLLNTLRERLDRLEKQLDP